MTGDMVVIISFVHESFTTLVASKGGLLKVHIGHMTLCAHACACSFAEKRIDDDNFDLDP